MPLIEHAGIAPRFPQIKPYLKAYSLPFKNWQREELPILERYAAGPAGATLRPNSNVTQEFGEARQSLFRCSRALYWHAVQTALGSATIKGNKKTKAPNLKTTEREFEKLIEGGKHVHRQIPPALNARDFKKLLEPEFDKKFAANTDAEISRAEFAIVRHLLLEDHTPEHVQQIFLARAPELTARKGEGATAYVAETLQRAAADPDLLKWREQKQSAQADAVALQSATGKNWQTLRRRSVAYDYWSCRMAAHSGGPYNYWFANVVDTATDCLVLGWEKEALTLFQQVCAHLKQNRFLNVSDDEQPVEYFLLRLIYDWQGWPRQSDGEPLFAALLTHWRTPEADTLAPLLLAACDHHTHQVIKRDSPNLAATYYPCEILAVLRLRVLHGLKNPPLEHSLMNTPLGALPEVTEPYIDELLENVLKQARLEFQDL